MSPVPSDSLFLAFEAAAGRAPAGASSSPGLEAFARQVVAAGRRLAQAPRCPTAALRRAEALFKTVRSSAAARGLAGLFHLVFDSWSTPQPALRGPGGRSAPRMLRFEEGSDRLDVEVEALSDGGHRLRIAAPLAAPGEALSARVLCGAQARRVPLDAAGVGSLVLAPSVRAFSVVLLTGRRERARTPEVALDRS